MDEKPLVTDITDYYPFGMPFAKANFTASVQPYKYGGKELEKMHGINAYDHGARWNGMNGRWDKLDPMAEKYYSISPYVYCGNNPVNMIDPTGMDWYQNNETKYYTWHYDNKEREGYSYIGEKGSVLGEFESIIDGILTDSKGFNTRSLYSEGFTFDIAPNDKGGLLGSKERGWDFTDEFANGVGPEFSVLLSDHPYTKAMKTDDDVMTGQQYIYDGKSREPGQVTNWTGKWNVWDALATTSMAKQFIGSYRYNASTSADGRNLNNVISDSKSRSSLFLHLPISNKNRSQTRNFANTYQFYIWTSPKK